MMTSGEREYRETHPWISFQLDLRQADPRLWVLLGQIVAFGEFVSRALLPPKVASNLARIYLAKGVQATVAIEGNTLSEEEVLAQIDDKLELPASREYLGREVGNVLDAANEIVERIHSGSAPRLTAAFVADCNGRILTGLAEVLGDEVEPGRIRKHSVGVGRYRGAPAEDCEYLLDQLGSGWRRSLNSRSLPMNRTTASQPVSSGPCWPISTLPGSTLSGMATGGPPGWWSYPCWRASCRFHRRNF